MSYFVPIAMSQSFFELQTPDFAWNFVLTVTTNYYNFLSRASEGWGVQGLQGVTRPIFELQTQDFTWKFIWTVQTNFDLKNCQKGGQGSQGNRVFRMSRNFKKISNKFFSKFWFFAFFIFFSIFYILKVFCNFFTKLKSELKKFGHFYRPCLKTY